MAVGICGSSEPSPSLQLSHDVHEALTRSFSTRRPVLHHLNADTSWLLQLPRPPSATKRGGRAYFNILIDPWFRGAERFLGDWFSAQWHAEESRIQTVREVDDLIWRVERLALGGIGNGSGHEIHLRSAIDAVAISHEFMDHCHEPTLREVAEEVPVFATTKAAQLIRSWKHFRTVVEVPEFGGRGSDWTTTSVSPLPDWVGISRLQGQNDGTGLHSALLIAFSTFDTPSNSAANGGAPPPKSTRLSLPNDPLPLPETPAECVVYTPHGLHAAALEPIAAADPPLRTLCLIHGLHAVSVATQRVNLGAHNALQAHRLLRAKYWVSTHDEVKPGSGFVGWLLRRKVITLEDALREEQARAAAPDGERLQLGDVHFEDVPNGESRILE